MNIACIIPSSCSKSALPFLKRCIESLRHSAKGILTINIVVVTDNKGARNNLKKLPIKRILISPPQSGFGQMNNIAIEEVFTFENPDYFLLINDDAWINKDFFKNFLQLRKRISFDLLNPIIFTKNSPVIDSFGVEYFSSGYAKNANLLHIPTTLATATCLLIKTSFLKNMGDAYGFYFNPLLYYYLEDVEFSIRAKAIGAKIERHAKLIAHHVGSLTSGKKSFFVMRQTYRNILCVIIMTWPTKDIFYNILSVIMVQGWSFIYGTSLHGPFLYLGALISALGDLPELVGYRKKILARYSKRFHFSSILSPHAFRTYHGKTITI